MHADVVHVVKETMTRMMLVVILQHYTRRDLEALHAGGETLEIKELGLVTIADSVSPELALVTIDSLVMLGAFLVADEAPQPYGTLASGSNRAYPSARSPAPVRLP